jgi:hypothetical protein
MQRLRTLLLCTAAAIVLAGPAHAGPLRQLFPKDLLLYAEIHDGRGLYDALVGSSGWRTLTQSQAYSRLMASPGLERIQAGRRFVDAVAGTDPVELALQTLGTTAAGAVWPKPEGGLAAAIVAVPDPGVQTAFNRLGDLAMFDPKNRRSSKDGRDVVVFEKGAMALGSGALALASDEALAVELASSLADGASRMDSRPDPPGFDLTLDLQALRRMQGRPDGPPDPVEPLGILLASGWTRILRGATELHARGSLGERGLAVEARLNSGTGAIDEALRPLYAPAQAGAAEAAADGQIGSVSLARDLGLWWRERRTLFSPEHRAKLAEAENVLNAFFSGPVDEVLAGLAPRMTLLVGSQSFANGAAPKTPLPAFALRARMTRPDTLGQRFLMAFQSGVVLTNMDRAQKRQGEPLSLDIAPETNGLRLVRARFPQEPQDTAGVGQGLRYNLSPACGVRGDRLVLSSAEGMARELLDGKATAETDEAGPADLLVIHAQPLAQALEAALPMLITNQMVEQGKSREQATQDLEAVVAVVRAFDGLRAEIRYHEAETLLRLEVSGRKEAL